MILRYIILVIVGISSGTLVAGGVAALLTSVGVVTRVAYHTGTSKKIVHYENCIIAGSIIGNAVVIYEPRMNLEALTPAVWIPVIGLMGICMGIFVGCLAMSLAEALDVSSISFRRMEISHYLWMVILAVAIGKFAGNIIYFFF